MKITTYCPICSHESEVAGGVTPEKGGRGAWHVPAIHIPISEGFLYPYTCSKGHNITMLLNNFKFEIIFDSGLNALHDGYLREAMTSFYAALEYFYKELSLYFMYLNNVNINSEEYQKFKKAVKLSERTLGLFHGLYYIVIGEPAPVLSSKISEDRNNVIHGSNYPSYEDAVKFGNSVKNYIVYILEKVEDKFSYFDWMSIVIQSYHPTDEKLNKPNVWTYSYLLSKTYRTNNDLKKHSITEYKPFWQLMKDNN